MIQSTRRSGRSHNIAVFAVRGILFMVLVAELFCYSAFAFPINPEEQIMLLSEHTVIDASELYLLPTDTEYITDADLARFTAEEIVLIRNEIYARHGYDFQTESIRAYFETKSWYEPISGLNASTFDASVLNEYETANIAKILAYEKEDHTSEAVFSEAAAEEIADIQEDAKNEIPPTEEQSWFKEHKNKLIVGGAVFAVFVFLSSLGADTTSGKSSSGSSGSSSYSSGGYSSSFDSSKPEKTFTQGGPTGCGIGGSFCGCGSGR